MKKPLLALTVLSLSLGSIITPVTATAALPLSVDGEQLPSLAPMLEKVTPAVVSIAVERANKFKPVVFQSSFSSSLVLISRQNKLVSVRSEV